MKRLPRWYRNGLVAWLCVGVPFWLVGLTHSSDPRWFLRPGEGVDPLWWAAFVALLFFPVTALVVAAVLGGTRRWRR